MKAEKKVKIWLFFVEMFLQQLNIFFPDLSIYG